MCGAGWAMGDIAALGVAPRAARQSPCVGQKGLADVDRRACGFVVHCCWSWLALAPAALPPRESSPLPRRVRGVRGSNAGASAPLQARPSLGRSRTKFCPVRRYFGNLLTKAAKRA